MESIQEGEVTFSAPRSEVMTKRLPVFYNPRMRLNRNISVLLLLALEREGLRLSDPLAGSGVRSLRFLAELPHGMACSVLVNDRKEGFAKAFRKDLVRNGLSEDSCVVAERDANAFLREQPAVDYVDIDPFGSPNPFLDSAVRRLRKDGVLAVTATDTAPLCGTYPKACLRKYWSVPRRDYLMHEAGLRILIRKCQLVAAQYDVALVPVFSYAKEHYFRVFFSAKKGKRAVDDLLALHGSWDAAGPLWLGSLGDPVLARKMVGIAEKRFPDHVPFLSLLADEWSVGSVGFFNLHLLAKELRLAGPWPINRVLERCHVAGIRASRTHFCGFACRATCDRDAFVRAVRG